ncbi:MAG: DUF4249 family protein [Sphingobacteriales bacterium]
MKGIKLKYGYIVAVIIVLAIASCQKIIDLKLNNAPSQIVIEANITDQEGPQYVSITKSVPFIATNNFPKISGAVITLSDDAGEQFRFTQVHSGLYVLYPFHGGVYGRAYTITVKIGDTTYTAQSTMPTVPVLLDSITDKPNVFSKSNLRTITVNYQDPQNIPNQYLFNLFINSEEVGTIFTNDDNFTDGRYVKEDLFQADINIHPGDTASVNMECIDKNIYQYWYTLSQQQANGPGGGVTPSNPPSNFNNNALGYFSAHTIMGKSIVVN